MTDRTGSRNSSCRRCATPWPPETLPQGLILLSALWCRYCSGLTDSGVTIAANDPDWDQLQARAHTARENPGTWLTMSHIYGDLAADPKVVTAFSASLNAIWAEGVETTLRRYLAR